MDEEWKFTGLGATWNKVLTVTVQEKIISWEKKKSVGIWIFL